MSLLNRLKRPIYNYRLKKLQRFFAEEFKPAKDALIISGAPRGGTTWVYEVIQGSLPAFGLWEPLHPFVMDKYYAGKDFWFHKYIPEKAEQPEMRRFLDDVCRGKFITELMLQENTRFKTYAETSILLVKFVRLNSLIPWFSRQFPQYKILQLHRNPIAVIASQLRHGAWNLEKKYSEYPFIQGKEYTPAYYSQFKDVFAKAQHPEEILAVDWALEFLPAILKPKPGILYMGYEDLFRKPVEGFHTIFNYYGEQAPADLEARLKKPSNTTKPGSNMLSNPDKQMETWKKHLSTEQVQRIRNILKQFGFSDIGDVDYSMEVRRDVQLDF